MPKSLLRIASEGFLITAFGDVLYKVLGVITTFVILAWVAPYDYGIWKLAQSALAFMSIVTLTGITGIAVADIARALGERNTARAYLVLWRSIQVVVGAGFVAMAGLLIAAPIISAAAKIHLTAYLSILAVSLLTGSVVQILQLVFQSHLKPVSAAALKLVSSIAYLSGIILLLPYAHLGVLGLSIAYVLSTVVPALVFGPYFFGEFKRALAARTSAESYSLREILWRRGKYALGNDYASIIETSVWPWVIGYFLSIEQVGYTGLAMVISSQVYSLVPLQYMLRAILPRFASDEMRMREWMSRALRYSLWAHVLAGALVVGAAYFLLPIVFPRYAVAAPLAVALLVALPFRAVGAVLTEWFYAVGKQRELFIATALPRLAALALLPGLLLAFHLDGFVAWYVLSNIATTTVRYLYVRRGIDVSLDPRQLILLDGKDFELLKRGFLRARTLMKL